MDAAAYGNANQAIPPRKEVEERICFANFVTSNICYRRYVRFFDTTDTPKYAQSQTFCTYV